MTQAHLMEMYKKTLTWAKARIDRFLRRIVERVRPAVTPRRRPPAHADERTMRRMAEQDAGGTSSAESAALYASGTNPAGTHGGKAVRREGPEHQRPELEEPQAREERTPGGEKHIPEKRSGA